MEVADTAQMVISEPYSPERDLVKYADTRATSVIRVGPGAVAIFYPTDGHMPTLQLEDGPVLVRKTVVKVPVA
jgi:YhcH/YjgK/YiaL family protein